MKIIRKEQQVPSTVEKLNYAIKNALRNYKDYSCNAQWQYLYYVGYIYRYDGWLRWTKIGEIHYFNPSCEIRVYSKYFENMIAFAQDLEKLLTNNGLIYSYGELRIKEI